MHVAMQVTTPPACTYDCQSAQWLSGGKVSQKLQRTAKFDKKLGELHSVDNCGDVYNTTHGHYDTQNFSHQ